MSLDFDGDGDYATIPSLDFRTTDFTIALWVYPRSYDSVISNLVNNKDGSKIQFSMYIWVNVVFLLENVDGKSIAVVKFPKEYVLL